MWYTCTVPKKRSKNHSENHPLHRTWETMKQRCYRPGARGYNNYGGRGISVCERWREHGTGFWNFVADMGERPTPGHTLDRIDNDGNYEPGNCRWATRAEQAANRRILPRALTEEQILDAWGRVASGESIRAVSGVFGVSYNLINDIALGKKWAAITGGAVSPTPREIWRSRNMGRGVDIKVRIRPEKKAEYMARADKAGMKLGPWIESMCDRPDPVSPLDEYAKVASERIAQEARSVVWGQRERRPIGKTAQALKKEGK